MILKQFTTTMGCKVIVNMEQVKHFVEIKDGAVRLCFSGDCYADYVEVKGTLKSIMRWYQKQNQAKKAKTIEIPQATFTPFYCKDNQTTIDITPKITW